MSMSKEHIIGTSGWNYDHWKGVFYPEDIAKKNWFDYYVNFFPSVEINYSFYRWPKEKTLSKWVENAPSGFKYTLKAPRIITHRKRLHDTETKVREFYDLTKKLKRHTGCHLFQLPPSFGKTERNLNRLKEFLDSLDSRKDNAVEFRDNSWWDDEIYELFEDYKVTYCTVSGLGMPDDVVVTSDTAYFRFHGSDYSTKYTDLQLSEWAHKMKNQKCKRIYAYFNNDFAGYAPANAKKLMEILMT